MEWNHSPNSYQKIWRTNSLRTYSFRQWIWYLCLFMKQNCHFDRGLAQYKHASLPMSFLGINNTLLGFPKRCIILVYLKRLKSYQPSNFKRVDFLSLYLVKRTFRLHFYWQFLSPLRYTKVIYLFGKPRSVNNNAWEAQGRGCMFMLCQTSVKMAILLHKQASDRFHSLLTVLLLSCGKSILVCPKGIKV